MKEDKLTPRQESIVRELTEMFGERLRSIALERDLRTKERFSEMEDKVADFISEVGREVFESVVNMDERPPGSGRTPKKK